MALRAGQGFNDRPIRRRRRRENHQPQGFRLTRGPAGLGEMLLKQGFRLCITFGYGVVSLGQLYF